MEVRPLPIASFLTFQAPVIGLSWGGVSYVPLFLEILESQWLE